MHSKSKKIQTILIIGFITIALPICLTKNVSSSLFKCSGDLNLNYDAEITSQKIIPLSGEVTFPVNVGYKISGRFANWVEKYLVKKSHAIVDLRIKNTPKWCTARISPDVINPRLSATWTSEEVYVHISFTEEAPAFVPATVVIEMHSPEISTFFYKIDSVTKTAEISFIPAYLPIIDATPKSTYKEISPGEIVTFDIDLENLGNAETEFIFRVSDVPDGWSASIVSNTAIGSKVDGDDPKKTIKLFIQPPYDFGYHNDREDIRITVKGRYFATGTGALLETEEYEMVFTVRVRGAIEDTSTTGFNPIVLTLSIVIIALIIIIIIMALIIKKQHSS